MPEIFTKNCKIKVIEYGSAQKPLALKSWQELKSDFCSYIAKIIG